MPTNFPDGAPDNQGGTQSGEPKGLTLEEFKSVCRAELNWLVTEYGFQEDKAQPVNPFANPFTVQFVRDDLTVVVEGINWGSHVLFRIRDRHGRTIGVRALNPDFVPPVKPIRRAPKGQAAEIVHDAQLLRVLGTKLLEGNLAVFEDAIDRIEAARVERENRAQLPMAVEKAVAAFRLEQWPRVIELLEPHEAELSPRMGKKLATARQKVID